MNGSGKSMELMAYCPACESASIGILATYDSFPAILFPIEEGKRESVREAPLESYCCEDCGHIFLNRIDRTFAESLYKDYYYLYPFKNLESMQGPYRDPFDRVAAIFLKPKTASLLEIGCDNVEQIRPFLARGYACTAINPGAAPDETVRFVDGFYGSTPLEGRFDYVVSRFNLEHILDLGAFFRALENNLAPRGVAIVQVPNVESFLKMGMLNVLAHEHPHYFCQRSLLALIRRQGYEVMHISSPDEPSLICVFTKPARSYDPRLLVRNASDSLSDLRDVIKNSEGDVVLYGAGLSLSGLLYSGKLDPESMRKVRIIDDNPMLQGLFMPNTRLSITNADNGGIPDGSMVVLTLNEQYHGKVIGKLKDLGAKCHIMAITEKGLVDVSG